ncbi:trypsin 3A1-like [Agrilus planipennis]|uniref:Trypsin 3A1-like n=1 Tax=Agrilus planipennis TaxID=224129 RepID=A0A7F5RB84_AGRPL|nr:trypsin 3A1-like [Agrilus planipennis]
MHLPPRRKIDNFVSDDVDADEPTNRIVGGEKVNNIEEYPFHVVMIGENDEHYRVCGGAIIADKFIITCAHCFVSIDAVDHHVKAGISNLLQKAQIREGAKVFKHKKYPGGYFENDIGLLKVKEPFKFSAKVGKIGLPHAAACFIVGDIVTILGFGQTTVHPTEIPNENLHVLKAPLTSRERCMERKIEFVGVEMTERVLCTDTPPGYGVCFKREKRCSVPRTRLGLSVRLTDNVLSTLDIWKRVGSSQDSPSSFDEGEGGETMSRVGR